MTSDDDTWGQFLDELFTDGPEEGDTNSGLWDATDSNTVLAKAHPSTQKLSPGDGMNPSSPEQKHSTAADLHAQASKDGFIDVQGQKVPLPPIARDFADMAAQAHTEAAKAHQKLKEAGLSVNTLRRSLEQRTLEVGWRRAVREHGGEEVVRNAFCPTGKGGGVDASCSPKIKGSDKTADELDSIADVVKSGGHWNLKSLTGALRTLIKPELDYIKKKLGIKDANNEKKAKDVAEEILKQGTKGGQKDGQQGSQQRTSVGAGSGGSAGGSPGTSGSVAGKASGPASSSAAAKQDTVSNPTGGGSASQVPTKVATPLPSATKDKTPEQAAKERVPASLPEINSRIDRMQAFFNAKGQGHVSEWLDKLRDHVNATGSEEALKQLASSPTDKGKAAIDLSKALSPADREAKAVQYWGVGTEEANWKNMGHFMEAYLARNGITAVTGDSSDPKQRMVSALAKPDKYVAGDFKPINDAFKDKLDESKHLPGLEKSEDINKLIGKSVTHLTPEVTDKLDKEYGKGKWIVKCYSDEAMAGYGIFFPQRSAAVKQDAQNTIWAAGEHLGKYGFKVDRDPDTGKAIGIVHSSGDLYHFGSKKYESTIHGDARHWGDKVAAASDNEHGAKLPSGKFMVQPAFQAVGISDADRAAGKTWHEKNEGRVHLATKSDGTVDVIPHSTWLKGGNLPVVFEDADTRAMAKVARDTIAALPEAARKGQVYAPDVMKTIGEDGKPTYKVVELNAQGDHIGSGYLHDNHFTIDAYTSHLTGREPAHVSFIKKLLTKEKRESGTTNSIIVNRLRESLERRTLEVGWQRALREHGGEDAVRGTMT